MAVEQAQPTAGWHDFYLMLGGAAAALIGLLFVGLSLHLRAVIARPELRALARQAFSSFLAILTISAFALIPGQGLPALGAELLLLGGFCCALLLPRLRVVLARRRAPDFADDATRFVTAAIANAGLLVISGAIWAGQGDALYWLVGVVLTLLVTAAHNAWNLLVEVGEEPAPLPTPAAGAQGFNRAGRRRRQRCRRQSGAELPRTSCSPRPA